MEDTMKSKYAQKVANRPTQQQPVRKVISQTVRNNRVVAQQVTYVSYKTSITKHERLV